MEPEATKTMDMYQAEFRIRDILAQIRILGPDLWLMDPSFFAYYFWKYIYIILQN